MPTQFLGVHHISDITEMTVALGYFMEENDLQNCLVVIVFANADEKYVQDNLLNLIPYWHYRSKHFVSFIFLGYEPTELQEMSGSLSPEQNDVSYDSGRKFSPFQFVTAIESFEKYLDWNYGGQASIIICKADFEDGPKKHGIFDQVKGKLDTNCVIEFNLEKAQKEGLIDSPKTFFEEIIKYARKNEGNIDEWKLSDNLGFKALGSAVFESLLKALPAGTRKAITAADYYRIKNLNK